METKMLWATGPNPPDLLLGHRRWRRQEVRAFGHVIGVSTQGVKWHSADGAADVT